jgi:two-component system chemotaxis response regulator CheY
MMAQTPARILVIDDAAVVRQYHRKILEQAGHAVSEAVNGMEAIEKLLQEPFDLCIVDVNMPVMDGYAFLHALRAAPAVNGLPVLMISTEAGDIDRSQALAAGANAYLVKPVAPRILGGYAAAMIGAGAP